MKEMIAYLKAALPRILGCLVLTIYVSLYFTREKVFRLQSELSDLRDKVEQLQKDRLDPIHGDR